MEAYQLGNHEKKKNNIIVYSSHPLPGTGYRD